jgi:hypothetical protein
MAKKKNENIIFGKAPPIGFSKVSDIRFDASNEFLASSFHDVITTADGALL